MGQPQPQPGATQLPAGSTSGNDRIVDDADREYEYDSVETEDVYFTLDLTTHVPNALVLSKREADSGEESKAQFIDLHTTNPLIRFNDNVYDCYWSTDLGSQFYIAQSGVTTNPRRPGTILDVAGVSRARLIGKPVTLTARSVQPVPSATAAQGDAHLGPIDDGQGHVEGSGSVNVEPGQPLVIPREECKNLAAERQASFLERLSAIKMKRGETDPVPMYSIKYYHEPENKEEIKQQSLAADHDAKKQSRDSQGVAPDRPRKRRKRLTAAEKGLIPEGVVTYGGRKGKGPIGARLGITETGQEGRSERLDRRKRNRAQQAAGMQVNEGEDEDENEGNVVMDEEADQEQSLPGIPMPGGQDASSLPEPLVVDPRLQSEHTFQHGHLGNW